MNTRDGLFLSVTFAPSSGTSVPVLRGKDGVVVAVVRGGVRVCDSVFEDKAVQQPSSHTCTHTQSSELVVVPGEVLSVVGGLTSNKHVPVLENLFFGQHLILGREEQGDLSI